MTVIQNQINKRKEQENMKPLTQRITNKILTLKYVLSNSHLTARNKTRLKKELIEVEDDALLLKQYQTEINNTGKTNKQTSKQKRKNK